MALPQVVIDFNNARTIDDKATVLTNYILTYRRNIAPGTAAISNCLFSNPHITEDDRKAILKKVKRGVVAALQFDYPDVDNPDLIFDFSKIEELSKNFDQAYLTSKKWQSQPAFFDSNVLMRVNGMAKIPINFAGRVTPVDYTDKSNLTVSSVHNSEFISNSTQFYVDLTKSFLFATVTTLTFTPVNAAYAAANPANLSATTLMNDANFTRQLDVCTYVLPDGDPKRAINTMRYDGTGVPHNNQVFYSPQHRAIIGDRAEVPHFHFPSNTEALLYTKKQSSDAADKGYTTAGCNAISCTSLQNYLQYLDGLTEAQLAAEKPYNMPFVEAKTKGIVFNLNIEQVLTRYINTARHTALTVNTMNFIEELYREIQFIQTPEGGQLAAPTAPKNPPTKPTSDGPKGIGFLVSNPLIELPDKSSNKPANKNSSFKDLCLALELLNMVHKKQEAETNPTIKAEMMALEAVMAKAVIESMSFVYNNYSMPTKKTPETNGNERNGKKFV